MDVYDRSVPTVDTEKWGEFYGEFYGVVKVCTLCHSQVSDSVGGPCKIRTCDQRIKSPLLYQLS
jgi:hypothetical protein